MSRAPASGSVFHAIADPTRRRVLELLRGGDLTVSDLQEEIGAGQSALSQHLAILREAGLVTNTRDGTRQWYRLRPGPLREVFTWARHFERPRDWG